MSKKSKELLMFKKLLPILFLFTGFQASAVVIGNLTYDGIYISGDGRTYVGFDTIASWDYATTLAATQVNGQFEGFRIANTADADYFIGSLFGANADSCSTVDGSASNGGCGNLDNWVDGIFGNSHGPDEDYFWFLADESWSDVGYVRVNVRNLSVVQYEQWRSFYVFNRLSSIGGYGESSIPWLLVKDIIDAPEPSIMALMGLGIFGIGFARRRRQS
jgi:hypothetical protein